MVSRVLTGACSKSAKISAQEDGTHVSSAGTSSIPPVVSIKRGRKRKSLLSVVSRSQEVNLDTGGSGSHLNEPEHLSSPQPLPAKRKLEVFLDMLQWGDKLEIFAEPVDGQEVVGYHDIIKDPMDIGTMRAKLHEGLYTSFEQFKRDVFLIPSNAMKFNASGTIYYKKAEAMNKSAQRLFRDLRREPEKFELEDTRLRRRPGRKAQGEASTSNARVPKFGSPKDLSLKRNTRKSHGPSHSKLHIGRNNNNASTSADKRMTYMPWKINEMVSPVLDASPLLQQVEGEGKPYWDSLMRFVKDLGPTAQLVARWKYKGKAVCSGDEASNTILASTPNNNHKGEREAYFTRLLNHPDPAPHLNREGLGFCSPNAALSRHNYTSNSAMPMGQEGPGSGSMQPNGLGALSHHHNYIANTAMPMGQGGPGPNWDGPGSGLMQLNRLGLGLEATPTYSVGSAAYPSLAPEESLVPSREGPGFGSGQPRRLGLGFGSTVASEWSFQTDEWKPTPWGPPPVQSQVNTIGGANFRHYRQQSSWLPDLDLQL